MRRRAGRAAPRASACLRTELLFLEASGWPSEAEHRRRAARRCSRSLDRPRRLLCARSTSASTRLPPFLARRRRQRASRCMLAPPGALEAQLRRDPRAPAPATQLRILLPLVDDACAAERRRGAARARSRALGVRGIARRHDRDAGGRRTRRAEIAARGRLPLSIGTNDLVAVHARRSTARGRLVAAHARATRACSPRSRAPSRPRTRRRPRRRGLRRGRRRPELAPLLVGLGVDELSVSPGAARRRQAALGRSGEPGRRVRQARPRPRWRRRLRPRCESVPPLAPSASTSRMLFAFALFPLASTFIVASNRAASRTKSPAGRACSATPSGSRPRTVSELGVIARFLGRATTSSTVRLSRRHPCRNRTFHERRIRKQHTRPLVRPELLQRCTHGEHRAAQIGDHHASLAVLVRRPPGPARRRYPASPSRPSSDVSLS